jgi:glucose/arabinose dehydrogenase
MPRELTRIAGLTPFAVLFVVMGDIAGAGQIPPPLNPRIDPARFRVTTFATGLNFPKSMQQLADGSLLVATSDPNPGGHYFDSTGTLRRLVDANGDGQADDGGTVLFRGLPGILTSVRQAGNLVFVTSSQSGAEQISVLRVGATPADPFSLVGAIQVPFPLDSYHTTYALAVRETPGEPGKHDVFFNVGSQFNDADSFDQISATGLITASLNRDSIYKVTVEDTGGTPNFSNLTQIATGLRNAAGIAIHPTTGDLYFQDNGIDGLIDGNEPLSADELNRIIASEIGGAIEDFGFADEYIEYRTGDHIGSGGVQPIVTFQPIPDPFTGSENEGASEIAFAPELFPDDLRSAIFVGFHGKFNEGGLANEENPLVLFDESTGEYYHLISNDEPNIGHLDGVLATADSLFVADISLTGGLFSPDDAGKGVIYQIQVRLSVVPEPSGMVLACLGTTIVCGPLLFKRIGRRLI